MRLHPAVATALVLVGGVLLALPLFEWIHYAIGRTSATDTTGSSFGASVVSFGLGLAFVGIALVTSLESRSNSGSSS